MNPELQQLKDIHLPPAISMWPTAPGWIILLAIFLGLCSAIMYVLHQRYRHQKPAKSALAKLEKLAAANPEDSNVATEISILIRRTALCYFHREEIASLAGDQWLHFLNSSGKTTLFTEGIGRLLIDAPYRKTTLADLTPLFKLTRDWLNTIAIHNKLTGEK